ncbi:AmmeMemoRadiSam system protein A [Elusimicrobiota bacterium]
MKWFDEQDQQKLLSLARQAIAAYAQTGQIPDADKIAGEADPNLQKEFGAFVTLRKHETLYGCVGQMYGIGPLYKAVIKNAVSSYAFDHRFEPLSVAELQDTTIEISVIGPLETVEGPHQIVCGEHGILLEKDGARAVFLPQVAQEYGWTLEQMLERLCDKAGLPMGAWKEGADLQVFRAQIFSE